MTQNLSLGLLSGHPHPDSTPQPPAWASLYLLSPEGRGAHLWSREEMQQPAQSPEGHGAASREMGPLCASASCCASQAFLPGVRDELGKVEHRGEFSICPHSIPRAGPQTVLAKCLLIYSVKNIQAGFLPGTRQASCACVYTSKCVHVFLCACVSFCVHAWVSVCMRICALVCKSIWACMYYVLVSMCMDVWTFEGMGVHTCLHECACVMC